MESKRNNPPFRWTKATEKYDDPFHFAVERSGVDTSTFVRNLVIDHLEGRSVVADQPQQQTESSNDEVMKAISELRNEVRQSRQEAAESSSTANAQQQARQFDAMSQIITEQLTKISEQLHTVSNQSQSSLGPLFDLHTQLLESLGTVRNQIRELQSQSAIGPLSDLQTQLLEALGTLRNEVRGLEPKITQPKPRPRPTEGKDDTEHGETVLDYLDAILQQSAIGRYESYAARGDIAKVKEATFIALSRIAVDVYAIRKMIQDPKYRPGSQEFRASKLDVDTQSELRAHFSSFKVALTELQYPVFTALRKLVKYTHKSFPISKEEIDSYLS